MSNTSKHSGPPEAATIEDRAATGAATAGPAEPTADGAWTAAVAERTAAPAASKPRSAAPEVFPSIDALQAAPHARDLDMIMDIPVRLTVELGRTRLTIKQLLELAQGSVVELNGMPGEPMDILINGYLIAQGEVVVVEDHFGIRITEIVTPSERLQRLNG